MAHNSEECFASFSLGLQLHRNSMCVEEIPNIIKVNCMRNSSLVNRLCRQSYTTLFVHSPFGVYALPLKASPKRYCEFKYRKYTVTSRKDVLIFGLTVLWHSGRRWGPTTQRWELHHTGGGSREGPHSRRSRRTPGRAARASYPAWHPVHQQYAAPRSVK